MRTWMETYGLADLVFKRPTEKPTECLDSLNDHYDPFETRIFVQIVKNY